MPKYIAPSMMCADLMDFASELSVITKCGCEYLHIDVMDGEFVPNYMLGTEFVKQLHAASDIPLDIHLMVEKPEQKLGYFDIRKNDMVSFHIEATNHPQRLLTAIGKLGARRAVALNPATPLSVLDYLWDDLDMVLLMSVNPGYAGQALIPSALDKISELKKRIASLKKDILIEVDGNVSFENAVKMSRAGTDIFVAGSSSVYSSKAPMEENIKKLRECINL